MLIRKVEGSKHQVLVDIGDIYYLYSLYLELSGDELEEIPLMNESIISLDTKKLTIFALISHSKHVNIVRFRPKASASLPQKQSVFLLNPSSTRKSTTLSSSKKSPLSRKVSTCMLSSYAMSMKWCCFMDLPFSNAYRRSI